MRILLVNKFFYPRGGDCMVAINTRNLLLSRGHDVRVYAMQYAENMKLAESADWASEVDFGGNITSKIKAASRILGRGEIRKSFGKVLKEFRPDVVHLHNIHSYLSPVVGERAKEYGARVVWTMHDYKAVCPAYLCRRPDGTNCMECAHKLSVMRHRCMKGSRIASLMADVEARHWNRRRIEAFTDVFVAPSQFMADTLVSAGFDRSKTVVLPNFCPTIEKKSPKREGQVLAESHSSDRQFDYFCYVGRLSEEKGVETLIQAAIKGGVNLKIAGGGPLADEFKRRYSSHNNIEFMGHLDTNGVAELLRGARASVVPSQWYENNPMAAIESLCTGTPVIGAKIGGIPELIENATTKSGLTFKSGDVSDLAKRLRKFSDSDYDRKAIASEAEKRFSADSHYDRLMQHVYNPTKH